MRKSLYFLPLLFSFAMSAQQSIPRVLKMLNKESVPYIKVAELKDKKNLVYLYAREPKEYQVSHIKNALFVGYDDFKSEIVTSKIKDKSTAIVVYCSIGVRSENIGEKLQQLGYTNVYNLYGGIFEYKNEGGTVYNLQNKPTDSVHTYNKKWSKYLTKGNKVYE